MTKLAEKIEQLCNAHKGDRLVFDLELDEHGRPDCIMINISGPVMTELGMIDMAIRRLEDLRESIHEDLGKRETDHYVTKGAENPSVGHNEQALRERIKTLPDHLQGPVNAILDKVKTDLFGKKSTEDKPTDIKEAFMQDFFKEINKRFGFEGNALNPEM